MENRGGDGESRRSWRIKAEMENRGGDGEPEMENRHRDGNRERTREKEMENPD